MRRTAALNFDRSSQDPSSVAEWALGLAAAAQANVTAVYLYGQQSEGSTQNPLYLGAISPENVGQSADESRLARERIGQALVKFPIGTYTVAAFAQTPSGAPYELGTITIVIR